MKIAILGYSGSGKSTLARWLAEQDNLAVLHLDQVQYLPDWQIREKDEQLDLVRTFMENQTDWVIDGNYSNIYLEQRLNEADWIILMQVNRWAALRRVIQRYRIYKGVTRPDLTDGCNEKLDWDFIKWIIWQGRSRKKRRHFSDVRRKYQEKTVLIKNQSQLDQLMREWNQI
ncbi:AAA family ATPase [Vaginisenegalia massiliensis]|uniref:AAA family ATPase n=1 Tax=Vaginisenegalia massiliensis TaxID=2058294 RepID=UPI000F537611|nr:AAA family ATPase [Vaginisenegalia massiliensis]